jgi:hypothetical protein
MQDDPNTNNTDNQTQWPLLDCEDWQAAFEPYEGDPVSALSLGFKLARLRMYLDGQLIKPRPVMEALDDAMEVLFPFTEFHKASFNLFLRFAEGKLTFDEEQMLRALGVKF